jgi:hypothetical protein
VPRDLADFPRWRSTRRRMQAEARRSLFPGRAWEQVDKIDQAVINWLRKHPTRPIEER